MWKRIISTTTQDIDNDEIINDDEQRTVIGEITDEDPSLTAPEENLKMQHRMKVAGFDNRDKGIMVDSN